VFWLTWLFRVFLGLRVFGFLSTCLFWFWMFLHVCGRFEVVGVGIIQLLGVFLGYNRFCGENCGILWELRGFVDFRCV